MSETISISALRSNLKRVLSQIRKGKSIVITSRGKSIGMITPISDEKENALAFMEKLRSTAKIGDVVSPISVEWKLSRDFIRYPYTDLECIKPQKYPHPKLLNPLKRLMSKISYLWLTLVYGRFPCLSIKKD